MLKSLASALRSTRIDIVLAWRNVGRQWRRSAFGLSAISVGVAALILADGFIEWNFVHYREEMIHTQLGHIRIHRAGFTAHGIADPADYVLPETPPELAALRQLSSVTTVAPELALNGLVSHGDATLPFVAEGIDPVAENDLTRALTMTSGAPFAQGDADGIILGQGLARNLGARVGDRIALVVNIASGGINGTDAHVRGIFTTVSNAYDDIALRLPIGTARRLLRIRGADTWVVLLRNTDETPATLREVDRILGADKFEAIPWWRLSDFYNKSARLFSKQVNVMKVMIGLLIILSISNALTMAVIERTVEIGTAMALGNSRTRILRCFVAEGLMLGVSGAALGAVLGVGLAQLVSAIGIPVPPPPGMAHGYTGRIMVTLNLVLDAAWLAIGTTVLAALYPAWRASRMVVVDALRRNRA